MGCCRRGNCAYQFPVTFRKISVANEIEFKIGSMKKSIYLIAAFLILALLRTLPISGSDSLMINLSSLGELQNIFQVDSEKVRIVALLSPT